MIVLVDYDNVDKLVRRHGLVSVVSRVVDALGSPHLVGERALRFRLYGGWFNGVSLSRSAQALVPQVGSDFPRTITVGGTSGTWPIVARVEFAYGLEADPRRVFTHTFRTRAAPANLECARPPFPGCSDAPGCPIAGVSALVDTGVCPKAGCPVTRDQVLFRQEQKLVDTLITADLVHLARTSSETLALVSSDDDMWPGLRQALLFGSRIIHVHPVAARTTPPHYQPLTTSTYSQVSF